MNAAQTQGSASKCWMRLQGSVRQEACFMRVNIESDPFPADKTAMPWSERGQWPCSWIAFPESSGSISVVCFRKRFSTGPAETVRVHVTADERYDLFLDGVFVGRGSDRGDVENWFFESYDLDLTAGDHVLVARVWSLGPKAAYAQISTETGFLLSPQEEDWQRRIGTGTSEWEVKPLYGYEFIDPLTAWGTGHNVRIDGKKVSWGWSTGDGDGWERAIKLTPGMSPGVNDRTPKHLLWPSTLPPQRREVWTEASVRHVSDLPTRESHAVAIKAEASVEAEVILWQRLLDDNAPVLIEARSRKRVLIDLGNYVCAYPSVVVSGGKDSRIRIHWQEALYESLEGTSKGNRDEIEGKFFTTVWHRCDGIGDEFLTDGGPSREFSTLWWQAGRYVEIVVETAEDALTVEQILFRETRYPYVYSSEFLASDPRFEQIQPVMTRALEMCSHETYMDCPYFEQLQYIGDTRLQVLTTYCLTQDDRLPRKSLVMFDASRLGTGLTQSRYPSRVRQIIPPFSLWWVCMLHDFALWRGDLRFVRERMIGARGVLDAYRAQIRPDGLLGAVDGWNFVDWVPGWDGGMPKDAVAGVSGVLNLQFALTLALASQIETWLEEPEMATRHRNDSESLLASIDRHFWTEAKGLYANDLGHSEFSEHAQCLAILSNEVTGVIPKHQLERALEGLLNERALDRTTIYFSHYLFEAFRVMNRADRLFDRLPMWFDHPAQGLKTTIEMPEPTRSDCHAWGAHPIFHEYATILGIRPTTPGFKTVEIRPQLGPLSWARGTMPTPLGPISADVGLKHAVITLPDGMSGRFIAGNVSYPISGGRQEMGGLAFS